MAKLLKLRRGTTSQHSSFTGAEGECTVDTTKDTLVVHDNSTAGGRPLLREDLNNIGTGVITAAMLGANSVDSSELVDGGVDHSHLSNDCIDGDNIQDDVINSEHYAAASIDHEHLAADIVDGDNLADNAVGLEHMSSESVDEDNLYISNAGSNGQFLSKQSGNNGGLTWATPTTTAVNVTTADESSDTTCFPLFVTAATGDLAPKSGSNLAFNSSSGALTATSFAGDGSALTGVAAASAGGSIYECVNTISSNYTMTTNSNGVSAGPITVSATVTIPSGSVWSIV